MRNKILFLIISLLSLASISCGKLDARKKSTQPITDTPQLTEEEFKEQCARAQGRLASGNAYCLTRVIKELPAGTFTLFEIVPSFYRGQALVTTGEGKVDVLYEGTAIAGVPGKVISETAAGGALYFFANSGGYKNVSATVWSCFDRTYDKKNDPEKKMTRIYCPTSGVIP